MNTRQIIHPVWILEKDLRVFSEAYSGGGAIGAKPPPWTSEIY